MGGYEIQFLLFEHVKKNVKNFSKKNAKKMRREKIWVQISVELSECLIAMKMGEKKSNK